VAESWSEEQECQMPPRRAASLMVGHAAEEPCHQLAERRCTHFRRHFTVVFLRHQERVSAATPFTWHA